MGFHINKKHMGFGNPRKFVQLEIPDVDRYEDALQQANREFGAQGVLSPLFSTSLLLTNSIRLYSRAELKKISKFFDNPLKIAKITTPLSYFHLECVQENNNRKALYPCFYLV